jgi:hypothetical protein
LPTADLFLQLALQLQLHLVFQVQELARLLLLELFQLEQGHP